MLRFGAPYIRDLTVHIFFCGSGFLDEAFHWPQGTIFSLYVRYVVHCQSPWGNYVLNICSTMVMASSYSFITFWFYVNHVFMTWCKTVVSSEHQQKGCSSIYSLSLITSFIYANTLCSEFDEKKCNMWFWKKIQLCYVMIILKGSYTCYTIYLYWNSPLIIIFLTHLGLTLFCRPPPGPIREIEGFVMHICITREMRAVFRDAYMRHQAKMG